MQSVGLMMKQQIRRSEDMANEDEVRATSRAVAKKIAPLVAEGEQRRRIPAEVFELLAESGCLGRTLPKSFGGSEAGVRAFAAQQEELAAVWPTAAVACTWSNLSGRLISRFGSPKLQQQLLPGLVEETGLGAVAWTEPQGGSDAAALTTSARRVDGGWVLNGSKQLIDNARDADFFIVGARDAEASGPSRRALSMFVVRRDDVGFDYQGEHPTMGLRAAGVGRFQLDDCFVPDQRLLGEFGAGFYQMMDMVELGRTGVAAIGLGMAEACLQEAREFLRGRQSFGTKLSENDALLSRLADLRVKVEASRLLTEQAGEMADRGQRCSTEAAMAKLFASETACEVAAASVHLQGGLGFTAETCAEMFYRDCQAFTIGEGTSEIMRMIIGREEFATKSPA